MNRQSITFKLAIAAAFAIFFVQICIGSYQAYSIQNGAVIAVFPNGDKLGVKPGEFEVIDWLDVKEVLM